MLYRNNNGDLIYKRESDGKLFLLMEGIIPKCQSKNNSYDVLIVFKYDPDSEQFYDPVTWLYGASFAESDDTVKWLKKFVG